MESQGFSSEHSLGILFPHSISFTQFVKTLFISPEGIPPNQTTDIVLRQIDAFPYPRQLKLLASLISLMSRCAEKEEDYKIRIKEGRNDFNIRKTF